MDIHQFLELLVGRWRSQRSDHQFGQENGNDSRCVLEINALEIDDPSLVAICQKYDVDPHATIHSLQTTWEEESLSSIKPKGSALLVLVPNDLAVPHKGLVLSAQGKGVYEFVEDESLTIQTVIAQGAIEERIWYGNPNLRFRVATLLQDNSASDRHVQSSKFYSEIRISAPKT
ncbi:phycobiliprotein lyase [Pseudanabaena sp. ABRG5-3]|uniref:phycobiliprotein lyase n=1 Tax=Pseudanabaena sp. ABRG5-3 TaxID=685565 RepID=UPI000DC7430F|nr:phycobiliprotein lyase [Pseudanabaena sp. ABRG5-3]BBC23902.1 phycoerythrin-associated linker protein [Pseudanabaena sp. ABRG5-3]